jgi:subtilisin family serine protease
VTYFLTVEPSNGTGIQHYTIGTNTSTAALIEAADGEFVSSLTSIFFCNITQFFQLVKQFVAGVSITVSFPQGTFLDDHGGLMSDFSSSGPSFDFGFKPAFAAPGRNILSTLPVAKGSFGILSGTSMSTPFAAGAAALLLAAKPKSLSAPNGTRTLLETTSTKILLSKTHSGYDTLIKAGAGLINVYNAIHATTIVSPGELILNDTTYFHGK